MSLSLECKKAKRTGFTPHFYAAALAAAVPIVNMAVRSEMYVGQQSSPMQILMGANWQMMAMLNILLVVAGSCLLYHTEFADNAMQKMKSLPIRESSIFFGKFILTSIMSVVVLAVEAASIAFCVSHWFEIGNDFWLELGKNFGYSFLLMLPCVLLSLLISSACKNMWVSLGIGVVCVFTATMLPTNNFMLSLFPFATPFQVFVNTEMAQAMHYVYAAIAEIVVIGIAELVFIKVRRSFE